MLFISPGYPGLIFGVSLVGQSDRAAYREFCHSVWLSILQIFNVLILKTGASIVYNIKNDKESLVIDVVSVFTSHNGR